MSKARKRRKKRKLRVKAAPQRAKKSGARAKTSKKRNVRVKTDEDRLFWKIAGVGMLALAAFMVAALASFNWECVSALTETVRPQTILVGVVGNAFAYGGYAAL